MYVARKTERKGRAGRIVRSLHCFAFDDRGYRRRMRRLPILAAIVVVTALAVGSAATATTKSSSFPHVTLIGDSVATAIKGTSSALAVVNQGVDLDLETDACRRLEDASCPPGPPTVIDLIKQHGAAIGPTVVIAVGYNDFADHYAAEIDDVLAALEAVNVKNVFWLTLRAAHHPYIAMNDEIVAAAAKHPEVSVIDWNVYSRSHPEWFQDDGLHMLSGGAAAMAALIHQKLLAAGIAVPPPRIATTALPGGRRGHSYSAQLRAGGGKKPYAWSLTGRLPAGLRLQASGLLTGTPREIDTTGTFTFTVRVKDANGQVAARKLLLRLRR
jgi:lysophospholipase L1-like esterase